MMAMPLIFGGQSVVRIGGEAIYYRDALYRMRLKRRRAHTAIQ